MWNRILVVGFVISITMLVSPAVGQPADSWIGTWKLNVVKSKYSPGPAVKSSTVTMVAAEGGVRQTVESVPASWGLPTKRETQVIFDGMDHPVKGNPDADTSAYTKIDNHTYQVVSKKGGKPTLTSRVTISADGKTRTVVQTGVNAQGQQVNNVLVYERQ